MSDTKNADIKEITVTEGAMQNGGKRRSRKNKKGGGSTQGAIVQLHSTSSSSDGTTVAGINSSRLAEISTPTSGTQEPIVAPSQALQAGGKKVVLKAAKKTQKVVLSVSKSPQLKLDSTKSKTRKSKKISFSLKHLRNKLHKAKTIKKHSEEKSFDEIKKTLEEAKLIKKDSKAPEAMIRQIYSDFMTLKHKAL